MKLEICENDAALRAPLLDFAELTAYHDFLFLLVWREIHMRYRHTLIGLGWTFLNPLLTMVVFGLIVPNLVSRDTLAAQTQGVPYAVYVFCGLVPWTCFSHAVTRSNTCLVEQAPLLKNMYFPRLMLPLSRVLAALSELAIAFLALFVLMAVLRVPPSPHIVVLPFFLLVLMASSFGAGLILSMAQVRYRDVLFAAQYAMQLGLLVTPVWFSLNALPPTLRWVVGLNPMAAVVEGFRWAILGVDRPTAAVVATSAGVSLLLVWVGLWYFGRRHETVADYV